MTGIIQVGASVPEFDNLWDVFFCRVSGLSEDAFAGVFRLAGEDLGVEIEVL